MFNDGGNEVEYHKQLYVPQSPERALWFAVLEQLLIDYNAFILKKKFKDADILLRSLDTSYLEWICDNVNVDVGRIKKFMKEIKDGSRHFLVDMRYCYTNLDLLIGREVYNARKKALADKNKK